MLVRSCARHADEPERGVREVLRAAGLTRDAAVVLGNVGTADHVDVLTRAPDDEEPIVREHAAWALARPRAARGVGGA